jgi:hypothetical protein
MRRIHRIADIAFRQVHSEGLLRVLIANERIPTVAGIDLDEVCAKVEPHSPMVAIDGIFFALAPGNSVECLSKMVPMKATRFAGRNT